MNTQVAAVHDDSTDDSDTTGQYVTFFVDEQCFAFPMAAVLEIIRMPTTVSVPLTPSSLVGLANLRGTILPVVDMRQVLDLPKQAHSDSTRVVVTDCGRPLGLVVDRVSRVMNVEADQIEDARSVHSTINAELLTGVVKEKDSDKLTQLLDVERLVSREFKTVLDATGNHLSADTAAANAGADAKGEEEEDSVQLVSFFVDEQEYAFEIVEIEEIVRVPDDISRVPKADKYVLGLINLRGRLLPLVSLRRLFALSETELEDHNRILVITIDQGNGRKDAVGIVVDQVREVLRVPFELQDKMPALLSRKDGLDEIGSICRLEDGKRLVSVLRSAALFQHPGMQVALDVAKDVAKEEQVIKEENSVQTEALEIDDDDVDGDETQLVVFKVAEQEYGVLIEHVQEITRVPDEMNRVPKTLDFIEGLVNLRGTVLPVIDMRKRFSITPMERNERQRILVLNFNGVQTGLFMDSVLEVLRLSRQLIEDSPKLSEDQTRIMGKVANIKKDKRMIQVLDVSELLRKEEIKGLADANLM